MAVLEKRMHREKRHKRVRRKVAGTAVRPRLSVYRSNVHIYAQLSTTTREVRSPRPTPAR